MVDDGVTRFSVEVAAPRDEVWRWLRDPDRIQQWFGWDYPGLVDEIAMIFDDGCLVAGQPDLLHFGGHQITVVDGGDTTRLDLARCAPTPDEAAHMDWAAMADDIEEGWCTFLEQLRFALAAHPDDGRSALYLGGTAVAADPEPVWTALGLSEAAVGDRWARPLGPDGAAEGTVWHVSPLQVMVSVDAWGPGLLAATQAPNAEPRWARAAITVTTYGLAASAREELTARWTAWWGERYAAEG